MTRRAWFGLFAAAVIISVSQASAQDAQRAAAPARPREIVVELNKLEPVPNACRGYFLINNGTADDVKELRLDVYLFDKAGIILRRVGLTFPDIQAARSRVVLFDIPGLGCGEIGRLMVNDVLTCTTASGTALQDCTKTLTARTRTDAEFVY